MKTQSEINADIRERSRTFNLDVEQEDTLDALAAMNGNFNTTDETDNALALPLGEAVATLKFRDHPTWQTINDILATLYDDNFKRSQDDSLGREDRLSAMDRASGLKKALTQIGLIFSEAEQRMQTLSSDDKLQLGPEGNKMARELSRTPQPEFTGQFSGKSNLTVEQVKQNTLKAIAFLNQKPV